jgi:lipid-A-disaccharide synthase
VTEAGIATKSDRHNGVARVFLVAGEPSGDRLGGHLMAALRQRLGAVKFSGIGGEKM